MQDLWLKKNDYETDDDYAAEDEEKTIIIIHSLEDCKSTRSPGRMEL